ncbi:phosphatidylinositol alpha-1,6-mannosyltransferase [Pseudonocardia thermophila]|uniref:Phosphatidylinositol alpha-1,6-mannosyltransferase n=1 Tax=Pseudonocardia thermophila TaxID=1848 RepID=A0A1M6VY09_PSETH|nr:glycosyltransferase family 4 protein [Pseudonocardia thermophila]SHK86360.1 phosphatidylinositol alpha-1,6-mannosyltransferase [Pseudonocardia thermophila]
MPTLLVTNDFPPRVGGIQSYLQALADRLPPGELVVYASTWPGAAEHDAQQPYPVHRHATSLLLPLPDVAARAAALARAHGVETVWFGAAAPLGLLGPGLRRRAGVERIVASTHGHEIGWSMLPGGRQALRRIASTADVLTVVSRYTRRRLAPACGPEAVLELLRPGVDTAVFRPDPGAREELRCRYRIGSAPLVVCVGRLVARKGQDVLVRALPRIRAAVPGARLLLVGDGPDAGRLRKLAASAGVADAVVFAGAVPPAELPAHQAVGDVFAMPCRTRGGGLDVEGLGITFLEAAACGVPVVAGRSGGAPETVRPGRTGEVVDGRDPAAVARTVAGLLADPDRAAAMGATGRAWMAAEWTWDAAAARLHDLLTGRLGAPVGDSGHALG